MSFPQSLSTSLMCHYVVKNFSWQMEMSWLDSFSQTTLEKVGAKDVPMRTTGHTKLRITVMLSAKGNGVNLPPYILVPRKRLIRHLINKFKGRAVLNFCGTSWMNQQSTPDYIDKIVGPPLFAKRRLLVWDSFKPHISDESKSHLQRQKTEMAAIPRGCSGIAQCADVAWKKSYKDCIKEMCDNWMASGA